MADWKDKVRSWFTDPPVWESRETAEAVEERELARVTDIGVAFTEAIAEQLGITLPKQVQAIPAVYGGTQKIADTVGSLPMRAYDDDGKPLARQPLLLQKPDPVETYHDTLSKIVYSLIFDGNAYLIPTTRDAVTGEVRNVYVPHPGEVNVEWDARQVYRLYSWRDKNLEANRDIVHVALNMFPGQLKGVGPFTAARLMAEGALYEQNFANKLMKEDATPSGVIEIPGEVTEDEAEAIKNKWMDAHGNRKRPAILAGGYKFTPITLNPVDAQFIEQRQFTVQEIARLLGLPAYFLLVEQGSSLTYSTTESLFRLWLTSSLNPTYLERIQQAFTTLLPPGVNAQFEVKELLRADIETRYKAYAEALNAGWLTPNEVRLEEGLDPIEGGDELKKPAAPPQFSSAAAGDGDEGDN